MKNLKLKLKRIDPVKYALIAATLTAILTFILLLLSFLFLGALGSSLPAEAGFGAFLGGGFAMVIIGPLFYFALTFVFVLLLTFIMNFLLKKMGGLEMEFEGLGLDIDTIGKE